jgi:putative hydrolase of the HAD superfamily
MYYVFDLDDTLYLERHFVRSGFQAVGQWIQSRFGVDDFFSRAWQIFEKGGRHNIFDLVISELNLMREGLINELIEVYRDHPPEISLEPDAALFLESHDPRDMAIITDGISNVQWSKIKTLRLERLVDRIIATDDFGKAFWKPHIRSFVEISRGHDPTRCTYIADNPSKDFRAPEQLGWASSIRIRRPKSLHYDKTTPGGCMEITSLSEIVPLGNPF